MKMRLSVTTAGFLLAALLFSPTPVLAVAFGPTAQSFAVLGAETVTNTGATNVTGNLGVSPGTAITGSPTVSGTVYSAGPVAAQGQADIAVTYGALDGMTCDVNLTGKILGTSVGATTLTPGVYCFDTAAQLTGVLTLDADGDPGAIWVFQIASTLTTAPNSQVVMAPGGNAGNVFWQVTTSATVGTNTEFSGNLIALISVTLTTGASVDGRVFARTGAVTMDTNMISTSPFVPNLPLITVAGNGAIHIPKPNDFDPDATGLSGATFEFTAQRFRVGGGVIGQFNYNNPIQRVFVSGKIRDLTVLARNANGSPRVMLMTGFCDITVPQCDFAVTVEDNGVRMIDELGITVTGALNEVRSQRPLIKGFVRITRP